MVIYGITTNKTEIILVDDYGPIAAKNKAIHNFYIISENIEVIFYTRVTPFLVALLFPIPKKTANIILFLLSVIVKFLSAS